MYLVYKIKQVLKRNLQSKMMVVRFVKIWRRNENNKYQLKYCRENSSKIEFVSVVLWMFFFMRCLKLNLYNNDFF